MQCYLANCRTNLCSDWSKITVHEYNNKTYKMVFWIFQSENIYGTNLALKTVTVHKKLFQNVFPKSITFRWKWNWLLNHAPFTIVLKQHISDTVIESCFSCCTKIQMNQPVLYQQLKILFNYVILLANVSVVTSLDRPAVN